MSARRERVRPRQEPKPPAPVNVDGDQFFAMMNNIADGQVRLIALLELIAVEHTALRLVLAECVEKMGLQDQVAEEKSNQ